MSYLGICVIIPQLWGNFSWSVLSCVLSEFLSLCQRHFWPPLLSASTYPFVITPRLVHMHSDLPARHIDLTCGSVTTELPGSKLNISGWCHHALYHHYWLKGPSLNMQTLLYSVCPFLSIMSIMFSPFHLQHMTLIQHEVLTILIIN